MTDPNDQLTALHTLATEWPGGIEECPWYAQCVRCDRFECWYTNSDGNAEVIDPKHALDLITAKAERWLVGKGWSRAGMGDDVVYLGLGPDGCTVPFTALTEALKYAQGQA